MTKKPKLPSTGESKFDLHETPELDNAVYLLGMISMQWNYVEQMMSVLLWRYVGGHEIGPSITGGLGNKSKTDILVDLVRKKEKRKNFVDLIMFCVKAFNVLRENRNILIHSHSIHLGSGLIDQSQKMTVAAMQMAEKNVWAHRS